ncbi:MAG: redoxin domain-containing protein [Pirellulales bacterium]
MAIRQFAASVVTSLAIAILIVGCSQSPPPAEQAAQEGPSKAAPQTAQEAARLDATAASETAPGDADVQPASAAARLDRSEEQVEQAVATAPALPVEGTTAQPTDFTGGTAGSLPLEEPVDSGQAMPKVVFTEQHAKTSLVGVGDTFPKLELSDTAGKAREFGELVGEKLTIVVFWHSELPTSLEELADMQARFLREFGAQGVSAVGVNVSGDPQLAGELAAQRGAKFPQLCDRDGAALAKVCTEKLPRTYLLDASGKVLWFDTEYSRTTRQQLLSAIRFALKNS